MKKSTGLIIGIIAGIVIIAAGLLIWFLVTRSSHKITDDVELNDIKISKITINYENNVSTYRGVVTAKKDIFINYVLIEAYDKDNNKVQLTGYIGKEIKKDEKVDIVSSIDSDITGYKKITYEVK